MKRQNHLQALPFLYKAVMVGMILAGVNTRLKEKEETLSGSAIGRVTLDFRNSMGQSGQYGLQVFTGGLGAAGQIDNKASAPNAGHCT